MSKRIVFLSYIHYTKKAAKGQGLATFSLPPTKKFSTKIAANCPFITKYMQKDLIKCVYQQIRVGVFMQYVKKMCILRQLKQGFSCDGQPISGIVKAEQYGKNIAVDVSVLNLASLSSGQWYCLFADAAGRKQLLSLQETRHFSFVDEMDIARGFLAVLCFVGDDAQPIAVGTSGKVPLLTNSLATMTLNFSSECFIEFLFFPH